MNEHDVVRLVALTAALIFVATGLSRRELRGKGLYLAGIWAGIFAIVFMLISLIVGSD